jgi:hypothetical protein
MVFWCYVGVDRIANKEILLSDHTVHLCVRHVRIGAFAPKTPMAFFMSVSLFVCPHGPARNPLDGIP